MSRCRECVRVSLLPNDATQPVEEATAREAFVLSEVVLVAARLVAIVTTDGGPAPRIR